MKDKFKLVHGSADRFDAREPSSKRTFSGILQDIVNRLTEIVRSEIRLARTEMRQELTQLFKASALLIVSGLLAVYALGFLLLSAAYALATVLPGWASALIVGVGVGIIGGIFFLVGRSKLKQANLTLDQTIKSLQENATWVKKRTE